MGLLDGLLDPVYRAVDTTIASVGSVAGETVSSVGNGISATGRSVGDSITGTTSGWGNYVKDTGNFVKDSSKASGTRSGTANNPLGLARSQTASLSYGMNAGSTYRSTPAATASSALGSAKKAVTGAGPKPSITAAQARKQITGSATPSAVLAKTKGSTQAKGSGVKKPTPAPSTAKGVTGAPKSTGASKPTPAKSAVSKPVGTSKVTGAPKTSTAAPKTSTPKPKTSTTPNGGAKGVTGAAKTGSAKTGAAKTGAGGVSKGLTRNGPVSVKK